MPRLAPRATVVAVATAVLFMSLAACARTRPLMGPKPRPPLRVEITCATDTIKTGLTDLANVQAWSVELKRNDEIEWRIGASILEIEILPKGPDSLPVTFDAVSDGKSGKPIKAKVKDDAKEGPHAYLIRARCRRPDGSTIMVVIDPDMIILGH